MCLGKAFHPWWVGSPVGHECVSGQVCWLSPAPDLGAAIPCVHLVPKSFGTSEGSRGAIDLFYLKSVSNKHGYVHTQTVFQNHFLFRSLTQFPVLCFSSQGHLPCESQNGNFWYVCGFTSSVSQLALGLLTVTPANRIRRCQAGLAQDRKGALHFLKSTFSFFPSLSK